MTIDIVTFVRFEKPGGTIFPVPLGSSHVDQLHVAFGGVHRFNRLQERPDAPCPESRGQRLGIVVVSDCIGQSLPSDGRFTAPSPRHSTGNSCPGSLQSPVQPSTSTVPAHNREILRARSRVECPFIATNVERLLPADNAPPFTNRQRNEAGIAHEVATPKPPGLLAEPIEPLQTGSLHPNRSPASHTCPHVEAPSDTHCKDSGKLS